MVTGKKAFDGANAASVIAAILGTQPPLPSTLRTLTPAALDRLALTCLAKDPEERWQSARDVARELRWIAESRAQAPSVVGFARPQWSRRTALFVGIGAWIAGGLV